jgi:glycosyltransferase involved in cell wall biosynthesis
VGEARRRAFADACWLAERLVCCSEHLREEVIRAGHLSDERVVSLSPGLLAPGVGDVAVSVGATPGLEHGEFLVYPADCRPSKNHALLLTAFGMYRARHPESPLKLVCVGQPDGGSPALREAVQRMGLARSVFLIEHASQSRRRALLDGCRAVIYPSLYEASGQGIVEAIAAGKPLLCSHTPALAEVAQDAAVYFDPRRPDEIAHALDSMTGSEALAGLASRTRQRAATLEHEVEQAVTTCLAVVRAAAGQAARRLPQASRHSA